MTLTFLCQADLQTPMLPALDDSESPMEYSSQSEPSQSEPSQSEATSSRDRMWSADIQYIELEKGDRGLGFSILDYQVGLMTGLFVNQFFQKVYVFG